MGPDPKESLYQQVSREIAAVTAGEDNLIARMATVSCLLSAAFEDFFWTGFYLVDVNKPDELVIGPYQGSLGCLRIGFGQGGIEGVCGVAALTGQTQIVDNVADFPGHIACDSRSVSEIVVPVFSPDRELLAVLDIDSMKMANFAEIDRWFLEQIIEDVFARCTIGAD